MMTRRERDALATAAIARARALDRTPVLDVATLQKMSLDELDAYLQSHGVALDMDRQEALVREALGADLDALDAGVKFSPGKQARFEQDVERAVASTARLTAKDVMGSFREQILSEADERPAEDRYMIWVSKLRRPCADCEELHGQILSEAQWDDVGKPRSGSTLCGARCECDLVPVAVDRANSQQRIDAVNAQVPRRRGL